MVCNITGYSLAIGMCSALDTLVSQAYGAKAYRLMGLHCQRAMVILSIASILVTYIWFQTEFILHHILLIDLETSTLSGKWTKVLAIGLWPSLMFEVLRKFLQCQQIIWPIVVSSIIAVISNIIITYILVYNYNFGFYGCAYGNVIAQWISFISLTFVIIIYKYILYLNHNNYKRVLLDDIDISTTSKYNNINTKTNIDDTDKNIINENELEFNSFEMIDPNDNWPQISIDILKDWPIFLELGIPSALSLFMEWYI